MMDNVEYRLLITYKDIYNQWHSEPDKIVEGITNEDVAIMRYKKYKAQDNVIRCRLQRIETIEDSEQGK